MRFLSDTGSALAPTLALGAVLVTATAPGSPGNAAIAAAAIGVLAGQRGKIWAVIAMVVLAACAAVRPAIVGYAGFWTTGALLGGVALLFFAGRPFPAGLMHRVRAPWLILSAVSLALASAFQGPLSSVMFVVAAIGTAFVGVDLARRLALNEAKLRSWGKNGVVDVARDLLLGRVTSGMLHDLAQPLNVISMANGNLGYIIDRLEIEPGRKQMMMERSERIAAQTDIAARILGLFRWFGLNGAQAALAMTVRDALENAVTATKSNVRHCGVDVELRGDALDCLVPARHGALELMVVAALLSAFETFVRKDGTKLAGCVVVQALLGKSDIVIAVHCVDDMGQSCPAGAIDPPTLWLLDQVARENGGAFGRERRRDQSARFSMRIGRSD